MTSKYAKRHYEDFAFLLGRALKHKISVDTLLIRIGRLFEEDNPRFDRELFYTTIEKFANV